MFLGFNKAKKTWFVVFVIFDVMPQLFYLGELYE
jgi:hypothetical protein